VRFLAREIWKVKRSGCGREGPNGKCSCFVSRETVKARGECCTYIIDIYRYYSPILRLSREVERRSARHRILQPKIETGKNGVKYETKLTRFRTNPAKFARLFTSGTI
jgi:hypothetical protein